jgi:hypothetical protein
LGVFGTSQRKNPIVKSDIVQTSQLRKRLPKEPLNDIIGNGTHPTIMLMTVLTTRKVFIGVSSSSVIVPKDEFHSYRFMSYGDLANMFVDGTSK